MNPFRGLIKSFGFRSQYSIEVPIITELKSESSCQLIGVDRKQRLTNGTLFTNAFTDSLCALAYFSPDVVKLIETLISGGLTLKAEEILHRSESIQKGVLNTSSMRERDRSRVVRIGLDGVFSSFGLSSYGQLFVEALQRYGMLCFGVYRFLERNESDDGRDAYFVISNPSPDFQLKQNDLVFLSNLLLKNV